MQFKKSFLLTLALILFSSISVFAAPSRSRITGTDYISTSVALSQKWSNATSILLATVDNFPDALAGTALGAQLYAPLLYTEKDLIPVNVLTEINRLHPKTVFLLGGTAVISQSIEDDLTSFGCTVVRLAGNNRYETAVKVGQQVINNSPSTTAFLAVGDNFPDALAGGFFAGKNNAPILLTYSDTLNDVTKTALINWGIQTVYILGGTGVISKEIDAQLKAMGISTIELGGADRYETALKIDTYFSPSSTDLILATGKDFHSALIGSIYGSVTGLPVMLMDENISETVNSYIKAKNLTIIGNEISDSTINELNSATYTIQ